MDLLDEGCACVNCAFSAYGNEGLECMRYPRVWRYNRWAFPDTDEWSCCGEFKLSKEKDDKDG